MAVCGAAKVGSGNTLLNAGALTGVITAFNGTQVAGHDSLVLHIAI